MDRVVPVAGTEVTWLDESQRRAWHDWRGLSGPPVPVVVDHSVWEVLDHAVMSTADPRNHPRVFRLFMKRRSPRHVIHATEIARVWQDECGKIRWTEGGYPSTKEPMRKGGNAFIRGSVDLALSDAWWMGREVTDLRLLLAGVQGQVQVAAWWSRGSDLSDRHGTNGDLWRVRLLIARIPVVSCAHAVHTKLLTW